MKIYYQERGKGPRNILMLHGALGSSDDFKDVSMHLSESFRVVSPDLRGHGKTDNPRDFLDLEQMASDIVKFIKKMNLSNLIIYGYSLGGYIGLYLTSRLNIQPSALICHEVKFEWTPLTSEKIARIFDPDAIEEKNQQWASELSNIHGNRWKKLVSGVRGLIRSLPEKGLSYDYLNNVKCPVLMTVGDRSTMVTLEETIAVYKELPSSALFVVPFAGHGMRSLPLEMYLKGIDMFTRKLE